MNFILLNVHDDFEKTLKKYRFSQVSDNIYIKNKEIWHEIELIPVYRDLYWCLMRDCNYSFDELSEWFSGKNKDDKIGAISIIAKDYPQKLYELISINGSRIGKKEAKFLLESVVPDFLPIILPREKLIEYDFKGEYKQDIWVKIFEKLKTY